MTVHHHRPSQIRIACLTAASLVAFDANSILCRLALDSAAIDAASFSTIRLLSGLAILGGVGLAIMGRSRPL
jgi:hypothetical protein